MVARSIGDILGPEVIAAIRRPIAEARGLPARAYTSREFFDLEQQSLFPKVWMGVGFTSDVPSPGDAVPVMVAGVPIILCRDSKGDIRGYHNVCRHRASLVLTEPCKGAKVFTCPYHAWAYGLDGRLRAIPYYDGTRQGGRDLIDFDSNGLVPVRVDVWKHWIFVNLDGKAPALIDYLRPLDELVGGFELEAARMHTRVAWNYAGNWKLMNDNWETYHHIWVHKGIFEKMSEDLDLATGEPLAEQKAWENVCTLQRRPAAGGFIRMPAGRLPTFPARPGMEAPRNCTSIVFPNVTVTVASNHIASVITNPVAPDKTIMQMGFMFVGEGATDPALESDRNQVLNRWLGKSRSVDGRDGIRSQDMHLWEGQQIARQSHVADDVKFSPTWEINVHRFQNRLIEALT